MFSCIDMALRSDRQQLTHATVSPLEEAHVSPLYLAVEVSLGDVMQFNVLPVWNPSGMANRASMRRLSQQINVSVQAFVTQHRLSLNHQRALPGTFAWDVCFSLCSSWPGRPCRRKARTVRDGNAFANCEA